MLPTCSAPSGTSPVALSAASSTATSSPNSSPRKSEMTLFQNSQRLMSAEGVSTTKSGNVVYRLRFEDGSVYLTEPDGQVGSAVTNYVGKIDRKRSCRERVCQYV